MGPLQLTFWCHGRGGGQTRTRESIPRPRPSSSQSEEDSPSIGLITGQVAAGKRTATSSSTRTHTTLGKLLSPGSTCSSQHCPLPTSDCPLRPAPSPDLEAIPVPIGPQAADIGGAVSTGGRWGRAGVCPTSPPAPTSLRGRTRRGSGRRKKSKFIQRFGVLALAKWEPRIRRSLQQQSKFNLTRSLRGFRIRGQWGLYQTNLTNGRLNQFLFRANTLILLLVDYFLFKT